MLSFGLLVHLTYQQGGVETVLGGPQYTSRSHAVTRY